MEVRQNRIRVETGGIDHIGLKAEPDQLAARTAIPQRTFPVFPVATNQVQAGDTGIVETAARLGAAENGGSETPGAVGVIERERAFSTGTDDQDVLITFERLTPLLGRKAQVGSRRGKDRSRTLTGEQRFGAVAGRDDERLSRTACPVISRGLLPS